MNSSIAQLGIDDKGGLTDEEKQAKTSDLFKARSGIYHGAAYETDAMKAARPKRGSFSPGTHWYYNNWDFNVLGTILEAKTGQTIGETFYSRIASQIGMEDFVQSDVTSYYEPVSVHPAYLFKMSARDMARFGLLYLHKGEWEGRQVVPQNWIEESTKGYSSAGVDSDYGYLWWVNKKGTSFRAAGQGGQVIIVIPNAKLVIAHVSNYDKSKINSNQAVGQIVNYLLEAKISW